MKDEESADGAAARWTDLSVAAALLTRAPVAVDPGLAATRAANAVWAYPIVGAALGAATGLVLTALTALGVPAFIAAAVALAFAAIATGALHEDGLADCADGIGGGWSPERRLDIMKDSRIGAYGALALIFASLARWGAVAAIAGWSGEAAVAALALAGAVSRAPLGAIMRWTPNARAALGEAEAGLSASVGQPPAMSAILALALGGVATPLAAIALGLSPQVWAAVFLAFAAAVAMTRIARRMLGGQTGDVLGAAQVLAEIAALTALAASG